MTIVVRTRSTAASRRCAWCHDAEGGASGSRCGGCRTWLHTACWAEAAQGCPTRGCPSQRRVAAPRPAPAPAWVDAVCVLGFLVVLLIGAVTKFHDALGHGEPHTMKIDPDITAKINGGGQ